MPNTDEQSKVDCGGEGPTTCRTAGGCRKHLDLAYEAERAAHDATREELRFLRARLQSGLCLLPADDLGGHKLGCGGLRVFGADTFVDPAACTCGGPELAAFRDGVEAQTDGKPIDNCPHAGALRALWRRGWLVGKKLDELQNARDKAPASPSTEAAVRAGVALPANPSKTHICPKTPEG